MIPKIIHYCWLSDDPFPPTIQRCIDSWKKYLPDYEFMLWDYKRFPRGKSAWVDQAFDRHKYAFAADYIRLYALREYGGIYLDSDVEVLKPFDDLLKLPYFIGQENTPLGIEAATLGCEKGWDLIETLYQRYMDRPFVNGQGETNEEPMPAIFRKCIESLYQANYINSIAEFDYNPKIINIFPIDWFSPKTWYNHELKVTPNTYSIHHFSGSWLKKEPVRKDNVLKTMAMMVRRRLVIWYKKMTYRHLSVSIITNLGGVAQAFYDFHLRHEASPFTIGSMKSEDFRKLVTNLSETALSKLHYITPKASRYSHTDYYPIATIGDTDIEVNFPIMCSRKSVTEAWAKGYTSFNPSEAVIIYVDLDPNTETIKWLQSLTSPHVLITNKPTACEYCLVVEDLTEDNVYRYNWYQRHKLNSIRKMISKQIKKG